MENLDKSIRKLQNKITHSNKLVISLGNFLECEQILNVSLDDDSILKFIKLIKSDKNITSINNKIFRCYKFRNMEYHINEKKHTNYKTEIIDSTNINLEKGGVRVKLLNFQQHMMEEFPCLYKYDSISDNNVISVNYDNMYDINIITEKNLDSLNVSNRIEIHINNQNIYVDKLVDSISSLISKILELS